MKNESFSDIYVFIIRIVMSGQINHIYHDKNFEI